LEILVLKLSPRAPASARAPWRRVACLLWAAPNSLLGLLLGLVWWLTGAGAQRVDGVLELVLPDAPASARPTRWRLPFAAITLGHVVLAVDAREMHRWRAHERVHVAQYERWGPLFLAAYLGSSLWQWLQGRRAYWDNRFEVEARRAEGG
jgi:hypothetical protein